MSDIDQESISTLSQTSCDAILQNIEDAAIECSESKDFISFSTILDMYLHDWSVYSEEERLLLMNKLYEILNGNHELLSEIGWDIPPILVSFIDSDFSPSFALSGSPAAMVFWKSFEMLAKFGNPKELLLTCCEIIGNLKAPSSPGEIPDDCTKAIDQYFYFERPLRNFMLKFHSLLQVINSCLKRIKTIYPSKFLGMAITVFINFLKGSSRTSATHLICRRYYIFIRDYMPPTLPENFNDNIEDLEKVYEDECYLQGKLLIMFFFVVFEITAELLTNYFISELIPSLKSSEFLDILKTEFEFLSRMLSMSYSLDIDLNETLFEKIEEAKKTFNGKDLRSSEDVFKLVIDFYNNSSFREKNPKKLPTSVPSVISLYAYAKYFEHCKLDAHKQDIMSLIYLQLQLFIPFTINPKLVHLFCVSSSMILTLDCLESNASKAHDELSLPENQISINTYLQNISTLCLNSNSIEIKKLLYLFLSRFLKHMNEELSYSYLLDTLKSCPFDDFLVRTLMILKELMSKEKYVKNDAADENLINQISTKLNIKDLDEEKIEKKSLTSMPILPPRPAAKYIRLTTDRSNDLLELFDQSIKETFPKPSEFQIHKVNKLLGYLNFINSFRKFNPMEINKRLSFIASSALSFKTDEDRNDIGVNKNVVIDLILFNVNKGKEFYK